MKGNPARIVHAHYASLTDARTGNRRVRDYVVLLGPPLVVCAAIWIARVGVPAEASVGLLTVAGLLSAFFFGVTLQVAGRALEWADKAPAQGPDTSRHAIFLGEIAANAGYAALISILVATVFVVASVVDGVALVVVSGLGLGLAVHLVVMLLMVLVRVYALTEEHLTDTRTGQVRPVTPIQRQNRS